MWRGQVCAPECRYPEALDPLRLELEAVIALGTELGSSASEVPVAY